MQFSLTPFPQDPNASALQAGSAVPGGAASLEAPTQQPAGPFSQVLAGVDGAQSPAVVGSQPLGVVLAPRCSVLAPAPMAYRAAGYAPAAVDAQTWQPVSLQLGVTDNASDEATTGESEDTVVDAGSSEERGGEATASADLSALAVQMLPGTPVTIPPEEKHVAGESFLARSSQPAGAGVRGGWTGAGTLSQGNRNVALGNRVADAGGVANFATAAGVETDMPLAQSDLSDAPQCANDFTSTSSARATGDAIGASVINSGRGSAEIQGTNDGGRIAMAATPGVAAAAADRPAAPRETFGVSPQRNAAPADLSEGSADSASAPASPESTQRDAGQAAAFADAAGLRSDAVAKRTAVPKEKTAGSEFKKALRVNGGLDSAVRTSLDTEEEELTAMKAPVGIGGAYKEATMSAGPTNAHVNASDSAAVSGALHSADVRPDPLPQQVALTSSAHRAVEAVLDVTDRFAARERHSVDLQFTVGDADLKVRVQMKAGEVHTTFRTDSAELRAALSSEWQSVSSQNSERSTRLAPPVFASNDQGSSFSGDGASRQRDEQSREPAPTFFPSGGDTPRTVASASSASTVAVAAPRSASGNSLHLHTLA